MAAQPQMVPVPDIEKLFRPTQEERARQSFAGTLRKRAIIDLRQAVKRDYDQRVAPALRAQGQEPADWRGIEQAMEPELSHRFYSSVRLHAQEMCFSSVQPTVERALPEMIALARDLATRNPAGGSLRLNPALPLPRYLTALDTHFSPGWVHSEYTQDDVACGAVVGFGGKVFGGQHPYRKHPGVVAQSISHWLKATRPGFRPKRILDMATTSGKNLFPYKRAFPEAEVHGIDLGAPVLRFGHAIAEHEGLAVHFSQQNAEHTDFPDGHFDLIVSSFFLHEIPLKATRNVLRECVRLLAPGGLMVHMELPDEASVDAYENFFWNWDTANNHEPFYTGYREQDPVALSVEAGFARGNCFKLLIPDAATFGEERYAKFLRGELAAPPHGSGGWFIFGASK
jgi:SAM-dependent methyltransferase